MTADNGNHPERVDEDPTAAELEQAGARLRGLPAEEVVKLHPHWVESVVAAARSTRQLQPTDSGAVARPSCSIWRRVVATVVATIGLQGATTAMAVTTAGAVAAVVLAWTAGHDSNDTMSYRMALQTLTLPGPSQEDRISALKQVYRRAQAVVEALRVTRSQPGDPVVVAAAEEGLLRIRAILTGAIVPQVKDVADTLVMSLPVLRDPTQYTATRLEHLGRCIELVTSGLAAIHAMPANQPEAGAVRQVMLKRLLDLLPQ